MTTDPRAGSDADVRVPLYVLAGGRSRRFGSDKARALIDGVPLLVSVVETLAAVAGPVTVVAAADDEYQDLGLRTIGDIVPAKGPLGGLLTAIQDLEAPGWFILAACDWFGIRGEWIADLTSAPREGAMAVVFRTDRYEPLLGLYHTGIESLVRTRLDGMDLSMQSLLGEAATVAVDAPPSWIHARNLNRHDDIGLS